MTAATIESSALVFTNAAASKVKKLIAEGGGNGFSIDNLGCHVIRRLWGLKARP